MKIKKIKIKDKKIVLHYIIKTFKVGSIKLIFVAKLMIIIILTAEKNNKKKIQVE